MSFFGSVKGKAQQAQFEANKLLRVNQVQREINNLKRQNQQTKYQLGIATYEMFLKNGLEDEGLASKCKEIQAIESQITDKEGTVEEIKREELYIEEIGSIEMPAIPRPSISLGGGIPAGHKIASPAAALAVIFFFMPWVFASCGRQPIGELSGWEFAAGTTINTGLGAERLPSSPILFLILLSAIVVLILAYLAWQRGRLTKFDSIGLIALGIIPLLILYFGFGDSGYREEAARDGITYELMYGLWGTVISFIAILLGGVLNLRQPKTPFESSPAPEMDFEE